MFRYGSRTFQPLRVTAKASRPVASMVIGAWNSTRLAALCDGLHSRHRAVLANQFADRDLLDHLRALLARVVEQHLVELAAQHLPGAGRFVLQMLEEVERQRCAPAGADELHAVLLREVRLLHLVEHADALEREVTVGQQRFADVIAGKLFFLEHHDAAALLRQHRRRRRARGTAADHDGVVAITLCTIPLSM